MSTCAHCDRRIPSSNSLQCVRCKLVVYCSKDCQVAAWKHHKKDCSKSVAHRAVNADQFRQALFAAGATAGMVAQRHQQDVDVRDKLNKLYAVEDYKGIVQMRDETIAAAERMREHASPGSVAIMYGVLGTAMRVRGCFEDAYSMFSKAKEGIDSFSASHDDPVKSQFYTNLAYVLQDLNRDAESREMHEYAVKITRDEAPELRLTALGGLACCFAIQGDYEQSKRWYDKLIEAVDQTDGGVHSARAFQQYAAMEMAFGNSRCAYGLFIKCRDHLPPLASKPASPLTALAIMGIVNCMWNVARTTTCSRERAVTLQSFETHLEQSKTMPRVDFSLRLQMHMFSAFERHIHGDSEQAHRNVLQMICVLMKDARDTCCCCGRARSETRLSSCGHCRIARFCDVKCQRKSSSKKEKRKKYQVLLHSDVCDLMDAYRVVREREPEVMAAGAAAEAAGQDVMQAKLDKVAESSELAYRLEDLSKEFLDVKTAFAPLSL